ncbi:MAG: ribokinase [Phycisphaeraceae bacterium]|nr:MAG: ribokinase [Phycisphaeraceae bacterium]
MPESLVVLGSMNADLVVRSPRLPAPGETLLAGAFETHPGGKGANQAVAAARAGATVRMLGARGDDANGALLARTLADNGVDTGGVLVRPDAPTGVALITVDETTAENTIIVAAGANMTITRADVESAAATFDGAGVLLMQLEVPIEAVAAAAQFAKARGVRVILNAAPAPERGNSLPVDLLRSLDLLIVNRTEAAIIAGGDADPADLARLLLELGPAAVCVTLGPDGAVLADGSGVRTIPAFPADPIDTVGAGDAFAGALAAALAGGLPLDEAARRGAAAGALATTRRGAIPSLPSAGEIAALVG